MYGRGPLCELPFVECRRPILARHVRGYGGQKTGGWGFAPVEAMFRCRVRIVCACVDVLGSVSCLCAAVPWNVSVCVCVRACVFALANTGAGRVGGNDGRGTVLCAGVVCAFDVCATPSILEDIGAHTLSLPLHDL